jgi:hypothetical protein
LPIADWRGRREAWFFKSALGNRQSEINKIANCRLPIGVGRGESFFKSALGNRQLAIQTNV